MEKNVSDQYIHSSPGRVVIVTSRLGDDLNMMASGWHTYLIAGAIVPADQDKDRFLEGGSVDLDNLNVPLYIGRSTYRTLNAAASLDAIGPQ